VLCEIGFIDNEKNLVLFDTAEKRKAMAIAIAKGVLKTLGEEYVEEIIEEDISEPTVDDIKEKRTIGDILFDMFNLLLELFSRSKS